MIRKRPGEGGVLAFGVISECFWWSIFEPALRARDFVTIERCFQFADLLAEQGDQLLQDAISIRVLDYLFEPSWREIAVKYSGPTLREIFTDPTQ
ncbi:hypothetical protein ACFVWG_25625 [Kribbella sp. NPDC058245]|uniref:DUF7674 family protein n=1 Tax=Kribbella sp. NPDC058245 TaxID=3346399 RepID=UPI0036E99A55